MENTKINQLTAQTQTTYKTALVKQTETYTRMLTESLGEMNIDFSNYQKICVINCIQKMKEMLTKEGLDFSQIDQSNITSILTQVSMLQLNISASPRPKYDGSGYGKQKKKESHRSLMDYPNAYEDDY